MMLEENPLKRIDFFELEKILNEELLKSPIKINIPYFCDFERKQFLKKDQDRGQKLVKVIYG